MDLRWILCPYCSFDQTQLVTNNQPLIASPEQRDSVQTQSSEKQNMNCLLEGQVEKKPEEMPAYEGISDWLLLMLAKSRSVLESSFREYVPDFTFRSYGKVEFNDIPALIIQDEGCMHTPSHNLWLLSFTLFFGCEYHREGQSLYLVELAERILRQIISPLLESHPNIPELKLNRAWLEDSILENDEEENVSVIGIPIMVMGQIIEQDTRLTLPKVVNQVGPQEEIVYGEYSCHIGRVGNITLGILRVTNQRLFFYPHGFQFPPLSAYFFPVVTVTHSTVSVPLRHIKSLNESRRIFARNLIVELHTGMRYDFNNVSHFDEVFRLLKSLIPRTP